MGKRRRNVLEGPLDTAWMELPLSLSTFLVQEAEAEDTERSGIGGSSF